MALPVNTAARERRFSALKLIKNHLITAVNNDRLRGLGDLGVLSVKCLGYG